MAKRRKPVEKEVDEPNVEKIEKPSPVPNRVKFTCRHTTNIHNFAEGLVYVCESADQANEYIKAGVAEAY